MPTNSPAIIPFPGPVAVAPGLLGAMDVGFDVPSGFVVTDVAVRVYREGENPYPGLRDPLSPGLIVCVLVTDRTRGVSFLPLPCGETVPAQVEAAPAVGTSPPGACPPR